MQVGAARVPWNHHHQFEALLDRETASRTTQGNSVRLLVNGVESFRQRAINVDAADVIFLKTYNFRDDTTGRDMVARLKARALAGARVFVQFDVKGFYRSPLMLAKIASGRASCIPPLLQPLVDAGVVLIPTNTPSSWRGVFDPRDHEKYLLTWKDDGSPAALIMGGMNIGDEWSSGGAPLSSGFRDTDVELKGPVTAQVIQRFFQAAKSAQTPRLDDLRATIDALPQDTAFCAAGAANIRFVSNDPGKGRPGQYIEKLMCELLAAVPAGEPVRISSAFFSPTPTLQAAFRTAAERGVRLQFLLNATDAARPEFRLLAQSAESALRALTKACPDASIELRQWHGHGCLGAIHQKVASFGRAGPFIIGSSNLDAQSLRNNTEGVVLIDDPVARAAFDRMFDADIAAPGVDTVDARGADRRNWMMQVGQWSLRTGGGRWL